MAEMMREVLNPFRFTLHETGKVVQSIKQQRTHSQIDDLVVWMFEFIVANQKVCRCTHYQLDHHSPGGGWAGYGDICQIPDCGCFDFITMM